MNFGPITQLGYLTDDLNETAKLWVSLGVGPFTKMTNVKMPAKMNGEPVEIKIDLGLSYMGDIQIELIKPICDSPSPYRQNVQSGIWGAHHTQFTVADLDSAISKCELAGMKKICEISSGGGRYIYLYGEAGWIELTAPHPGLTMLYNMIKKSCAEWDGETIWNSLS